MAEIEDLLRKLRSKSEYTLEDTKRDLQKVFYDNQNRLGYNIEQDFRNERIQINNLNLFIEEAFSNLMNYAFGGNFSGSSFSSFSRLRDDFDEAYKYAERELQELSETRLSPSEVTERLSRVQSTFMNLVAKPIDYSFISYEVNAFKTQFFRRYNTDLEVAHYIVNQDSRVFCDTICSLYNEGIKHYQDVVVGEFNDMLANTQKICNDKNEQLDKVEEKLESFDPENPIDTFGKNEEDLKQEREDLLTMALKQGNVELAGAVAAAYSFAINNVDKQMVGKVDVTGKTASELSKERELQLERLRNNPAFDLEDYFEESKRINDEYGEAMKAVTPVDPNELVGKSKEELMEELESIMKGIDENPTLTESDKAILKRRYADQYNTAYGKAMSNAERLFVESNQQLDTSMII